MNDREAAALSRIVTACFIGTWILIVLVGAIARQMDATAKRKWWPRATVLVGVLFVFFTTTLAVLAWRSRWALAVMAITVPATTVITYLNIAWTKFCDKCSAQFYDTDGFAQDLPMRFCSKCEPDPFDDR